MSPRAIHAGALYDRILLLTPKDDRQRAIQSEALSIAFTLGQARWFVYEQMTAAPSNMLLAVLLLWLTSIFVSWGMYSPFNATTATVFAVAALSVAGAVLLIQELYSPYGGLLRLSSEPLRLAFARGVVVNVLNPKTALFFLAFLPQFIDADRGAVWSQALVLGLVFVALGLVSDSLYAVAAGSAAGILRRRRRAMRYGSGLVYIGLGATAALAKRT